MRRAWVVLVAVVLLASGCGDDDGGAASTSTTADLQGLLSTPESVPDEGFDHTETALGVLGDDPQLDAAARSCFHADLSACDDLYVAAPEGSLYEGYGATCGARIDRPTRRLCVDVLVGAGEEPDGLGGDEFLDALADQCYAGDLFDCDLLYAEADTGSQYEAYGASCGRRSDTEGDCVDLVS